MLGSQVCCRRWQPLPGPGLLVSRPGACLGVVAVPGVISEPLMSLTERLLALAAAPAAPLDASLLATAPAMSRLPLLLAEDGESCHCPLQGRLLRRTAVLLSVGRPHRSHHRLLGVPGVPNDIGELGQLHGLQLLELDSGQLLGP